MAGIDYYSKTGCRVGETDNYDSQTQLHHCLGFPKNPSDDEQKHARNAMAKFIKETKAAQLLMKKVVKETDVAQKEFLKKVEQTKKASQNALVMTNAVATYYKQSNEK